ncbi:MAG: TonB-dependent receptor [Prevotellaceae bacterium]|jgi:TonB-linked SusC/RagA family outer membrane protein|nr:TonB-dependent receptor [Prevotellaceae bacterium]
MKKILSIAFLTLLSMGVISGQTKVTGKVTDLNTNDPVSYASVAVKGYATAGTFTDDNGNYSINMPEGSTTILVSFVGYKTQEIVVNTRSIINVALEPDVAQIEESFVVAYGTAKKSTYTGSAAVVKNSEIKDAPSVSLENALIGKVAGMQVTSPSGQAGSTSSIRIRGIGSMNASNDPLYVVDGVPVISGDVGQMGSYIYTSNSAMNSINNSDIESITVLKDAASAALYGSRAANGVIIITTKKGKSGKPRIDFKTSIGITPSFATDNWELASPEEQIQMEYEIFWNGYKKDGRTDESANSRAITQLNNRFNRHGYSFSTTDNTVNTLKITGLTDGKENREGKYFNWDDVLFRTAIFQTHDLSVSGGNDRTTYYSSIAYTKEQGRSVLNGFDRVSGRLNVNQKINKYIEFATNVSLAKSDRTGFNDTRNTGANYFLQSRNLLWPLYWPTDYKTGEPWIDRYGSYAYNPVYHDKEWENSSKTIRISVNETMTVNILPELVLKSIFSYDHTHVSDHLYYSKDHWYGVNNRASVTDISTNINNWVSSTTLGYDKTFMEKHNVSVLAGFEAAENKTDYLLGNGKNLPNSLLHTIQTAGVLSASGYYWGNTMASILSRAEYNYDGKYFVSVSFRRDGSSKLAPDKRWSNFWSISGAWNIKKENFMQNIDYLSNLRFRLSYGINGTLPPSNYGWRSLIGYTYKYNEEPGGAFVNIENSDLSWERNFVTNAAVEFGFFDNRLRGSIEYYNRDTKDLLQSVPISMVVGFSSVLKNVGEINNKGWEIEIGGDIISNKDWKWDVSLNASLLKSKVTKLYGGQDVVWNDPTGGDARCRFIYREGQSTLALYGIEWAGVDQSNGRNVWYTNNDNGTDILGNGRNASYNYQEADQIILADMHPAVQGAFNTGVSWKGISLNLNFIYRFGGYMYDGFSKDVNDDGYYWERTRAKDTYDGRWTYFNDYGKYPMLDDDDLMDAMQISSRHKHPGSFVRLKNITLSYNLPKNLISKLGLTNTRVYFVGSNLLTLSAYKIFDPEGSSYYTKGWEMPIGKTYTFGIELSF